jgi:hypothetical protein
MQLSSEIQAAHTLSESEPGALIHAAFKHASVVVD